MLDYFSDLPDEKKTELFHEVVSTICKFFYTERYSFLRGLGMPDDEVLARGYLMLPEEELPMNATGMETLNNIWDLFETSLRMNSPYARTKMFEMAKWLEESQNLLDWIEQTPKEKQAWMDQAN